MFVIKGLILQKKYKKDDLKVGTKVVVSCTFKQSQVDEQSLMLLSEFEEREAKKAAEDECKKVKKETAAATKQLEDNKKKAEAEKKENQEKTKENE